MAHAALIKLALTSTLLAVLAAWQRLAPRRGDASVARWRVNLAVIAVATLTARLLLPIGGVVVALWAQTHGIGLFNRWPLPPTVACVLSLVALDAAIYWQHRAFHAWPVLWRVHRVHHTDTGFDTSLGLRFHPIEILLSLAFKLGVVIALGIAPVAILLYEMLLLAMSLFTHADVALPQRVDAALRWLIVTPDWHRVHHSIHRKETDSNYGNWLSAWDRIFRTHTAQPRDGHCAMRIGLPLFPEPEQQTLIAALTLPLLATPPILENHDA